MSETGADYVDGQLFSYQDANEDKNHNAMSDPRADLSAPQVGMILFDTDTGKAYLVKSGPTFAEIHEGGSIVCNDNAVVCNDNEVVYAST